MSRSHSLRAAFCLSLLSFANALPSLIDDYTHDNARSCENGTYDYIIVGGGTSGLTVANRLTEDPSVTVLVVEYGYLDNNFSVLIPYEANFNNYRDAYNITSTPLIHLNNEPALVDAAATVGGGSVINGMFFDRASAADYNAWEQLGNEGWGWEGMLPYFIKSTNFTPPTAEIAAKYNYTWNASVWGTDGPVHASIAPFEWPEEPLMFTAWSEINASSPIAYPVSQFEPSTHVDGSMYANFAFYPRLTAEMALALVSFGCRTAKTRQQRLEVMRALRIITRRPTGRICIW